jgi:hypothetical protein
VAEALEHLAYERDGAWLDGALARCDRDLARRVREAITSGP